MKKRIFIGFLALVFSLGTIFALSACGTNAAAGSPLQTEKKYINEESVAAASISSILIDSSTLWLPSSIRGRI